MSIDWRRGGPVLVLDRRAESFQGKIRQPRSPMGRKRTLQPFRLALLLARSAERRYLLPEGLRHRVLSMRSNFFASIGGTIFHEESARETL